MEACKPVNEEARLAALYRYDVLDTSGEADFDDITRLAARICDVPVALISLVDRSRQFFKSTVGTDWRETPLGISFCAHALLQPDMLVVPDLRADARFADNALVTGDPHVRFYAGALLKTPEGQPLGTLCVLDIKPRTLTGDQKDTLRILARQVMTQLELRRSLARERRIAETLQRAMLIKPQAGAFPGLDVQAIYEPAWDEAMVGGDFFDAFALPDGRVGLVVGDVSGKGIVAAEYTAKAKYALRVYVREGYSPAEALARLNDYLLDTQASADDAPLGTPFITLAVAVVTPETGEAVVSLAATEPPLVRRANGGREILGESGIPLGIDKGETYKDQAICLEPGDLLLMLTDGITEARHGGALFGYENVERVIADARRDAPLLDIGGALLEQARAFADGNLQDDVCILLARRSETVEGL